MAQPQLKDIAQDTAPALIDLNRFGATKLERAPYDYMIVPGFIRSQAFDAILADYPEIAKRGSFALSTLHYGPVFTQLMAELRGKAFCDAIGAKFGVDLTDTPTMSSVRGMCGTRDGYVHTDTESKIISLLLYMNPAWEQDGGRLRLLNSKNIDDVATEIPPEAGTLLVFRRSDRSWHGHKPFIGPRKVVQVNWITHEKYAGRNDARHRWSSFVKKLNPFKQPY